MPKAPNKNTYSISKYPFCFIYERNGLAYTSVYGERKTTKLSFKHANKGILLDILERRVLAYHLPNSMDLQDLIKEYLKFKESRIEKYRKETLYRYLSLIKKNFKLNETIEIRNYILTLIDNSQKSSTIKLKLTIYRQLFNYAIDNGYCQVNPIGLNLIPSQVIEKKPLISRSDLNDFIQRAKEYDTSLYNVLFVISHLGLRRAEANNINLDKDFKNNELTIIGKGKRIRVLPIDPFPELLEFFNNNKGRLSKVNLKSITNLFRYLMNKQDYKFSFKDIRRLVENELIFKFPSNVRLVANFIGHTLPVQEQHYADLLKPNQMRELMK